MSKRKKAASAKVKAVPVLQEDQVKAADLRERITKKLNELCLLLDEGTGAGLSTSFQLKPTPDGVRTQIAHVLISRTL